MAEIQDLSVTDSANTGRWPENMQFSSVNNAGRSDEGLLARWYKDMDASITALGSSNAFTATSNRTIAAYFNNLEITFEANHSITGASTFNLNGIGAKAIKRMNGDALASGDITSGQPVRLLYKSSPDVFYMMNAPAALATGSTYFDFTENASPGTPSANVGRLYAYDDGGLTALAVIDSAATARTLITSATETEMEAGTTSVRGPTVASQKHHPGHPKAGVAWNGSGVPAIIYDYGVSSISDNGTGLYTINFDTAFSGGNNYWGTAWARSYSGSTSTIVNGSIGGTRSTTAFACRTAETSTGNAVEPTEVAMTFLGTQ